MISLLMYTPLMAPVVGLIVGYTAEAYGFHNPIGLGVASTMVVGSLPLRIFVLAIVSHFQ